MSTKKMSIAGVAMAVAIAPIMGVGSSAAFANDELAPAEAVVEVLADEVPADEVPVELPVEEPVVEVPADPAPVDPSPVDPVEDDGELPNTEIPGEGGGEDTDTPGEENPGEDDDQDVVALTAPGAVSSVTGPTTATLSGFSHDPVDQHWGLFTHYTVNVDGRGYETDGAPIDLSDLTPDTEYTAEIFYGTTFGETSPTTTVTFRTEGTDLTAPYVGFIGVTDTEFEIRSIIDIYENWHGQIASVHAVVTDVKTGEYQNVAFGNFEQHFVKGLKPGTTYSVAVTIVTTKGFESPVGVGEVTTLGKAPGGEDGGNTGGENGGENPGENGNGNGNGNNGGENGNNGGTNNGNTNNGNGGNTDNKGGNIASLDGVINKDAGITSADLGTAQTAVNANAALAETGAGENMLGALATGIMALGLGAIAFGRRAFKRNAA